MAEQRYSSRYVPQETPRGLQALAIANPYESVLDEVEHFAKVSAIQGAQDRATNDILSGGNPSPALGITPAGLAYNEAAQRAWQARAESTLRTKAHELATQFDGRNPTDPDSFAKVYGGIAQEVVQAVPEQWRGPIALEAQVRTSEAVTAIRGRAQQIAFQQDVKSINDGFDFDMQDAASAAQLGRQDLVLAALNKADEKAQSLVDIGAINEDSRDLMRREGREAVASETIYRGFLDGQVSLEAVRDGQVGGELSARRRDALVNKIEAEISHRRSEANHAIAVAERGVRLQSEDLESINRKQNHGIPLTDAERQRRDFYLNNPGTVRLSTLEDGLASKATATLARDVATMTPQQIEAYRAQWAMEPPKDEVQFQIREKAIKAFDARQRALADDPAAYAASVLPDKFPPVVLPPPSDPGFDAALAQAASNATLIESQFGVRANPFTKDQQTEIANTLAMAPAQDQVAILGRIEAAFGSRAHVVHEGLAKQGAKIQAHAGTLGTQGASDTARNVLLGSQLLKENLVKAPTEDESSRAFFASGVPSAFPTDAAFPGQIRDAATALAAQRAALAGKPDNVQIYLPQAIKDVGGDTTRWGRGGTVALPLNVSASRFADRLAGVTDSEIAAMAGNVGHYGPVADAIRAGTARLESIGEGRYFVTVGTDRAKLPDGRPFVLRFDQIAEKPGERPDFAIGVRPFDDLPPEGR